MTEVLKGLSTELLYRLAAVWIMLWVLMMWFAPDLFFETGGIEPTDDLVVMARWMGLAMASIAVIHWVIPMWAGENINNFSQVAAGLWAAFFLMNVYDLYAGITPSNGQNLFGTGVMAVFAALLYLKSQ